MELDEQNGILEYNTPAPHPVGIYGWRKRCLYSFVLALMAIVIINLALTVWILRVLDFSLDGMGRLKIVPKGFKLQGEAEFLKSVYVNKVKSEEGKSLFVQSNKAVELMTTDQKNRITSKIVIDKKNILAKCDTFQVEDTKGNINLLITDNKVVLGSGDVTYEGDIKFGGSVSTPLLRSPTHEPLEIYSETSKVQISGLGGVTLQAEAGDVSLDAADNINIASATGTVHINSQKVLLAGLPKADAASLSYQPYSSAPSLLPSPLVYQLCVCETGRVFMGLPRGDCRSSTQICSGSQP